MMRYLLALGAFFALSFAEYNATGTDYSNTRTGTFIYGGIGDDASDEMSGYLKVLKQVRPKVFLNKGPYIATIKWIEKGVVKGEVNATVKVTRASNKDPMIADIWLLAQGQLKQFRYTVNKGVSDDLPYGGLRVEYDSNASNGKRHMFRAYEVNKTQAMDMKMYEKADDATTVLSAIKDIKSGTGYGLFDYNKTYNYKFAYDKSYVSTDKNNTHYFDMNTSNVAEVRVLKWGLFYDTNGSAYTESIALKDSGNNEYHYYPAGILVDTNGTKPESGKLVTSVDDSTLDFRLLRIDTGYVIKSIEKNATTSDLNASNVSHTIPSDLNFTTNFISDMGPIPAGEHELKVKYGQIVK